MHLGTDTVDLCLTVRLPDPDPLDKTLELLVVIPVRLEVVIIDEELECRRISTGLGKILASLGDDDTYIVFVTEVVLLVEIVYWITI